MHDFVTICLPCFNARKTIVETLNSIIKASKGCLILIGDNCSTDGTQIILKEFENKYKNIKLILRTENIGYCNNINDLVSKCSTKYVAIYHSDDIYDSEILLNEIYFAEQYNLDFTFVRTKHFYDGHKSKTKKANYRFLNKYKPVEIWTGKKIIDSIIERWNFLTTPSLLVKREIYLSLNGFNNNFPSNEDLDLWIRGALKNLRFGLINKYLMNYRRSNFNGSSFYESKLILPIYFDVIDFYNQKYNLLYSKKLENNYYSSKTIALIDLANKLRKKSKLKSLNILKIANENILNNYISFYSRLLLSFPRIQQMLTRIKFWLRN